MSSNVSVSVQNGRAILSPIVIDRDNRSDFRDFIKSVKTMERNVDYEYYNKRYVKDGISKCGKYVVVNTPDGELVATDELIDSFGVKLKTDPSSGSDIWSLIKYKHEGKEYAVSVVTDRYGRMDYSEILDEVYKVIKNLKYFEGTPVIHSAYVSPTMMRAQISLSDVSINARNANIGDVMTIGVKIVSSMTGKHSILISDNCEILECHNGMTSTKNGTQVGFRHVKSGVRRTIGNRRLTDDERNLLKKESKISLSEKVKKKIHDTISKSIENTILMTKGMAKLMSINVPESEMWKRTKKYIDEWNTIPFARLQVPEVRAEFDIKARLSVKRYQRRLGSTLYSVIQALNDTELLKEQPKIIKEEVATWATKLIMSYADEYMEDESDIYITMDTPTLAIPLIHNVS